MFLETIRCENGEPHHLSYHQRRLEHTLKNFSIDTRYDLQSLIIPPDDGLYRCRFVYSKENYTVEYLPYTPKAFRSLKIVHTDTLEYPFKYADREALNALFEQRDGCDDVLIVKNGFVSDTTIANIALHIDGVWFTPETPILEGTTRMRLLDGGKLRTRELTLSDLAHASKIALMNAMIGFVEVESGIIC